MRVQAGIKSEYAAAGLVLALTAMEYDGRTPVRLRDFGKTPAHVAGLDLPLDKIRWMGLIKQATRSRPTH